MVLASQIPCPQGTEAPSRAGALTALRELVKKPHVPLPLAPSADTPQMQLYAALGLASASTCSPVALTPGHLLSPLESPVLLSQAAGWVGNLLPAGL